MRRSDELGRSLGATRLQERQERNLRRIVAAQAEPQLRAERKRLSEATARLHGARRLQREAEQELATATGEWMVRSAEVDKARSQVCDSGRVEGRCGALTRLRPRSAPRWRRS